MEHRFRRQILAKPATIGFLGATTPSVWRAFVGTFETGLRRRGWIDGANIAIDYEWAEGDPKQFGRIAKKFARRGVDVIVTSGTGPVLAAEGLRATSRSCTRRRAIRRTPGFAGEGGNGRLLEPADRSCDPSARQAAQARAADRRPGILGNGGVKNVNLEMERSSRPAGSRSDPVADVRKVSEIAPKIKAMKGKVDALFVCTDPFVTTHHIAINIAAAAAGLPTIHAFREYVEGGGLASYGPDFREMFTARPISSTRSCAARGREIKVKLQKDQIVINRSTAKALGIKIPKGIKATMIG